MQIELAHDREPWLRQPGESEKQYVAFQEFLAQTPPRTVTRLQNERSTKSAHLRIWASRNRWAARAEHYDGFLQRRRDADLVEARSEMNRRHAQLAKAMSAKVAARIQNLQPDELSPGELGRWMQVISMVERLALGEGTIVGSQTNVQVNVAAPSTPDTEPDRVFIGEVMDRLSALGIVPAPLPEGIVEGEVVEDV